LETELARAPLNLDAITQAGVTIAVAWSFTQMLLPGVVDTATHPALAGFAAQAEQLPVFLATPAA